MSGNEVCSRFNDMSNFDDVAGDVAFILAKRNKIGKKTGYLLSK